MSENDQIDFTVDQLLDESDDEDAGPTTAARSKMPNTKSQPKQGVHASAAGKDWMDSVTSKGRKGHASNYDEDDLSDTLEKMDERQLQDLDRQLNEKYGKNNAAGAYDFGETEPVATRVKKAHVPALPVKAPVPRKASGAADDGIGYSRDYFLKDQDESDDDLLNSARGPTQKPKPAAPKQPSTQQQIKAKNEAPPKRAADDEDFAPFGNELRDKISALEDMINTNNFSARAPVPTATTQSSSASIIDIDKGLDLNKQQTASTAAPVKPVEKQPQQDILQVIEKNEKLNEAIPDDLIQQASQLLSFDNKFYNVKKEVVMYKDYPLVARALSEKDGRYGINQCICMVQHFLYIGNTEGKIRVFDLRNQSEFEPLQNTSVKQSRVTTIDILEDEALLMSGHRDGSVAIWDLADHKLLKHVPDLHSSDVTQCRVHYVENKGNVIHCLSSEDSGAVRMLKLRKKAFFGGYNAEYDYLFKTKLQATTSISLFVYSEDYVFPFCEQNMLVGFGAQNQVKICSLQPIGCLTSVDRPAMCNQASLPYTAWGFGLTPSNRERIVPIFAFAWDRMIQLIYVNEDSATNASLDLDGLFISEVQEIIGLHFVGESTLFAVFEGIDGKSKEIKLLNCIKFYPGSYKPLEDDYRAADKSRYRKHEENICEMVKHAVLESSLGSELTTAAFQKVELSGLQSQYLLSKNGISNFSNSVQKCKQNVIMLNGERVLRARVNSWHEQLDHLRADRSNDWLGVLKLAMEIFNGDQRGYALLPDLKEEREARLGPYMRDLIHQSIKLQADKSLKSAALVAGARRPLHLEQGLSEAVQIIMKVAIEFCLNIGALDLLFGQIHQIFKSYDESLGQMFVRSLQPFIMSGLFRKVEIPEQVMLEFIRLFDLHGQSEQNPRNLEKIIQQLDFSNYSEKLIVELEPICRRNCLIQALQILKRESPLKILGDLFKKGLAEQANPSLRSNMDTDKVEIRDLYALRMLEASKKFQVEKSYLYVGYKLLLLMKLFLEGRAFPYGSLSALDWENYTVQIAIKLQKEEFLHNFLKFDPECFMRVAQGLFKGKAYDYLVKSQEAVPKLCASPEQLLAGITKVVSAMPRDPTFSRDTLMVDMDHQVEDHSVHYLFNLFLLRVVLNHFNYAKESQLEHEKVLKSKKQLDVQYNHQFSFQLIRFNLQQLVVATDGVLVDLAARYQSLNEAGAASKDFDEVSKLLNSVYLIRELAWSRDQILSLQQRLAELQLETPLFAFRITLFERLQQFVDCFELIMLHSSGEQAVTFDVFNWINSKLTLLSKSMKDNAKAEHERKKMFDALQRSVGRHMREMIELDVDKVMSLIERFFEAETYYDQLISVELREHPRQRFKFLKNYIESNEFIIKDLLDAKHTVGEKTARNTAQANKYHDYLLIYLELMCKLLQERNPLRSMKLSEQKDEESQLVDEKLLEDFVQKSYFQIGPCLNICEKYRVDRAIAILQQRDGKFVEAVDTYERYFRSQSLLKIVACQTMMIKDYFTQRDEINVYRKVIAAGKQHKWNELDAFFSGRMGTISKAWSFDQDFLFEPLQEYDDTLRQAIKLMQNDVMAQEQQQSVVLRILNSLDLQSRTALAKIRSESLAKDPVSRYAISKFAFALNAELQVKLAQNFIDHRKRAILMKYIPVSIQPTQLIRSLDIDMISINSLFEHTVKSQKAEINVLELILKIKLNEMRNDYDLSTYKQARGHKSWLSQDDDVMEVDRVCDLCENALFTSHTQLLHVPVKLFQLCGHAFHQHCLSSHYKESASSAAGQQQVAPSAIPYACLKCNGPDVINSTSKKAYGRRGTEYQSTSYIDDMPSSPSYEDDSYGHSSMQGNTRTEFLRMQQLESFDSNMADSFLSVSDFAMS